jgi:hypothetical protein
MKKIILTILLALSVNTLVEAQSCDNNCCNGNGNNFNSITEAPDIASTALLLGVSLTGLELLRRKIATAQKV